MTSTGLEVFDRTIQETNLWLKALLERIGGEDRHRAYVVLRGGLHALRDRLGPEAAAHLSAQLPMLIRGIFYEGWDPTGKPTRDRHRDEFLAHFRTSLPSGMKIDAEEAVQGVFGVLAAKIDPGETAKIVAMMPKQIREFWGRVPAHH